MNAPTNRTEAIAQHAEAAKAKATAKKEWDEACAACMAGTSRDFAGADRLQAAFRAAEAACGVAVRNRARFCF